MGRVGTIPNSGVQIAAALAIVSEPFLPFTAAKLHDLLKLSSESWEDAGRSDLLPEGHQLNEARLLFEKIEDSVVEAQVHKLQQARRRNEEARQATTPPKVALGYEDFMKIEHRPKSGKPS